MTFKTEFSGLLLKCCLTTEFSIKKKKEKEMKLQPSTKSSMARKQERRRKKMLQGPHRPGGQLRKHQTEHGILGDT